MTTFSAPSGPPLAPTLTRDQLVASSSGWVAVSLNLGCQGLGYVYQRRWGAFWIGGAVALTSALTLGFGSVLLVSSSLSLGSPADLPKDREELLIPAALIGAYTGALAVGIGSSVEAGLAVKRARRRLGS